MATKPGGEIGIDLKKERRSTGDGRYLRARNLGGPTITETSGQYPVTTTAALSLDGQAGRQTPSPQPGGLAFGISGIGKKAGLQGVKSGCAGGPGRKRAGRSLGFARCSGYFGRCLALRQGPGG